MSERFNPPEEPESLTLRGIEAVLEEDRKTVKNLCEKVYLELEDISVWVKRMNKNIEIKKEKIDDDTSHSYLVNITIEFRIGQPQWTYEFVIDLDDVPDLNIKEEVLEDLRKKCEGYEKVEKQMVETLKKAWVDENGNPTVIPFNAV